MITMEAIMAEEHTTAQALVDLIITEQIANTLKNQNHITTPEEMNETLDQVLDTEVVEAVIDQEVVDLVNNKELRKWNYLKF